MPGAPLPIDPVLPDVVRALADTGTAIVLAPPGAGKTTRVPRALLESSVCAGGEILVAQPRRLPARMAALRVAEELGEPVGGRCGYTVRFEDRTGPRTRLRFVTEGVLLRRLLSAPSLPGVSAVILDEFHERSLDVDLALGLCVALRRAERSDLKLLVMSATLEPDALAEFLGGAPVIRAAGRAFPVEIAYASAPDRRPLELQIAGAIQRLGVGAGDGDILVFLPGAAEIRRVQEALVTVASACDLVVMPLHGDLPLESQARVVAPSDRRKVILATNVAETSLTIDGVATVIDSGLARVASCSPFTGLQNLRLTKISQASAIQRAGRAGRTRPGRALRLYTREDLAARPDFELPEVARLDLSGALLTLAGLGVTRPERWAWFERPPDIALQAATELLGRLGAIDRDGRLTELGRQMLQVPAHPRIARLLIEGRRQGVPAGAAALAALLSEGDPRRRARADFAGPAGPVEDADALAVLDLYEEARRARFVEERLRGLGLDKGAVAAMRRAESQFAALEADGRGAGAPPIDERDLTPDVRDGRLSYCALAGFPDRVARRRPPGTSTREPAAVGEVLLCGGGSARLGPTPPGEFVVVLDAQERTNGTRKSVDVRLALPLEPEQLVEARADDLVEQKVLAFNTERERVEQTTRLCYGALILEETQRPAQPGAKSAELLFAAASADGGRALLSGQADKAKGIAQLRARLALLARAFPEKKVPVLDAAIWDAALRAACQHAISFAELRAQDPWSEWLAAQPGELHRLMSREVPERLPLPSGRTVVVNYEEDERPPWIAARLQDFFGLQVGPSVCSGRVPLVLHLLAPNQRAVQVTRDLAGFWREHYPALRRELSRRYPRHAWPEDGATATPPQPRVSRL